MSAVALGLLVVATVVLVAVALLRLPTHDCGDPTCPLRTSAWHSHTRPSPTPPTPSPAAAPEDDPTG